MRELLAPLGTDTCKLRDKGTENIYTANGSQEQAGLPITISGKKISNTKSSEKYEDHCILIKQTIANIYASNLRAPNFIEQTLKGLFET